MRAGPLDSLQRGVINLRANRELILLLWLQRALIALLSIASLVPFYLVLDIDMPRSATAEEYVAWTAETTEQLLQQVTTTPFWMAAIASSALLMVVLFVASFFQAGAFGVLAAGELRGVPGSTLVGGFRAFSWSIFQTRGGARLWKYFWLLNLILCFWLLWVLFAALAGLAAGFAFGGAGIGAGLALGCVSIVPLTFGLVLLVFWGWLAQAELGLRDCGVWSALASGLRIVLRRFGSMLVLSVVLTILTVGSAAVFLSLTLTVDAGLASFGTARTVLFWALQALQWVVGAIVHLVFAAALVAIARQEHDARVLSEDE